MSKNRLSHSACSKYQLCGQAYKYHYIDKIRPKVTSAALMFGNALDHALNVILTDSKESAEALFEKSFRFNKINDIETYLPTCTELVYAAADFDSDLLIQEDYDYLDSQVKEGKIIAPTTNWLETYSELKKKKTTTGLDSLTFDEKKYFNLMNWLSLKRKGFLMLDAYRNKVMPKLEKVYSVQEYVSIDNGDGDKIIGYVDLIADVKGIGTVILDNKTSSMEYEEDAVITSPQLSLYTHILEDKYKTRKAGYIVLNKQVMKNRVKICKKCGYNGSKSRAKTCDAIGDYDKRCHGEWEETISPEIFVQFMVDEIPKQTENIVIQNYDSINEGIKAGVFHRNFNSCQNTFGGPCPYLRLCYRNKMDGLMDLKKKDGK